MTSYVEYHGHGFWCRNTVLREWVRAVLATAKTLPEQPAWLPKACGYWDAIACAAKSNRADLRLHADVTDPGRQRECERLFVAAAERPLPPAVRLAAVLAVALVRGELAGAVPTDLEYWADDEWHEPDAKGPTVARVTCPECGAAATAPPRGETAECPRCGLLFDPPAPLAVARPVRPADDADDRPRRSARRPEPDDEDDDERPRRKKRRDDDEEETGWQRYKRSPVRFVVLGVLVVAMLVLGYLLYRKQQREAEQDAGAGGRPAAAVG